MVKLLVVALLAGGCAAAPRAHEEAAQDAATESAMRQVPIDMYMTDWCPYCRLAREWLDERGYSYTQHDVERDPRAAMVHQMLNPTGSVPTFSIDGTVVSGFAPGLIDRALRRAIERRAAGAGSSRLAR